MGSRPDRPTRFAADLLDSAAEEGARQSRSAKQLLDHWARVGRAVAMPHTAARRRGLLRPSALGQGFRHRRLGRERRTDVLRAGRLSHAHAHVWDNSRIDGPRQAATFATGLPIGTPHWPAWAPQSLTSPWP
jgi:hypothetical protein